ncbi:hypothetical protein NDU88_003148 [Pleurodeles waltl]|uniref:Uncharacterized protein n=1 Tax=Pleurodeles waltl TaxID=8319 RepID=A0AAV7LFY2_PLEWA|nr:hypothetical protein NDU88_003148 [Pleurodeles waltl]
MGPPLDAQELRSAFCFISSRQVAALNIIALLLALCVFNAPLIISDSGRHFHRVLGNERSVGNLLHPGLA